MCKIPAKLCERCDKVKTGLYTHRSLCDECFTTVTWDFCELVAECIIRFDMKLEIAKYAQVSVTTVERWGMRKNTPYPTVAWYLTKWLQTMKQQREDND